MAWTSNHMPISNLDVIIYPCTYPDTGLDNLYRYKNPLSPNPTHPTPYSPTVV